MKKTSYTKSTVLRFSNLTKLCGLLAISCFVFGCIAFQNKPSTAQEKKDEQTKEQELVPNDSEDLSLPSFVYECVDKNTWLVKEVDFPSVPSRNPYFVRGDLDGDGNVDYVVVVKSLKNKREGLLVCFRNKETKVVLLGLDPKSPPPFWFLTSWDIETKKEVTQTTDANGRLIGIKPKGESIVMKGEDWLGIVYWDGNAFRWKEVILNEGG
jgi:hypothetical protein